MHSRYTAYCLKNIEYLWLTTHPCTRRPNLKNEISIWANSVDKWLNLTIIKVLQGGAEDKIGKVEFRATYLTHDEQHSLHELSRFVRHSGHWTYKDGIIGE